MTGRMTTKIGRLTLPNPVICASGEPVITESGIRAALAAGAGGVIAKSVNERPEAARQLDLADYASLEVDGARSFLNRSGLTSRETGDWFRAIAEIDREAAETGRFVAASIVLAQTQGAVTIAGMARDAGLRVFELNVGVPHASEAAAGAVAQETDPGRLKQLVGRVRQATEGMELWVKLTGLSSDLPAQAAAARDGGADAVCMMGRFMAMVPDLETFAPVLGTSAAYGGGWALPIVCRFLAMSRRAVGPDFPLLGTNGVRSGEDVARMALAGASAIEALSIVMHEGFGGIARMIGELDAFLAGRGLEFSGLIGQTADRLAGYDAQSTELGRWRNHVPPETLA